MTTGRRFGHDHVTAACGPAPHRSKPSHRHGSGSVVLIVVRRRAAALDSGEACDGHRPGGSAVERRDGSGAGRRRRFAHITACVESFARGRNRGPRGSVIVRWRFGRSDAVVESDVAAVGVGEGECPTEGAVDRWRDDGVTVGDQSIVNGLDICGVEPGRGTDTGLSNGSEIGAGHDVADCERDRLRLEDDGVRRSGRQSMTCCSKPWNARGARS